MIFRRGLFVVPIRLLFGRKGKKRSHPLSGRGEKRPGNIAKNSKRFPNICLVHIVSLPLLKIKTDLYPRSAAGYAQNSSRMLEKQHSQSELYDWTDTASLNNQTTI